MVKGYIHGPVYEGESRALLEAGLSVPFWWWWWWRRDWRGKGLQNVNLNCTLKVTGEIIGYEQEKCLL